MGNSQPKESFKEYDRFGHVQESIKKVCPFIRTVEPRGISFIVSSRGCGKTLYQEELIKEFRRIYPDEKIVIVRKEDFINDKR